MASPGPATATPGGDHGRFRVRHGGLDGTTGKIRVRPRKPWLAWPGRDSTTRGTHSGRREAPVGRIRRGATLQGRAAPRRREASGWRAPATTRRGDTRPVGRRLRAERHPRPVGRRLPWWARSPRLAARRLRPVGRPPRLAARRLRPVGRPLRLAARRLRPVGRLPRPVARRLRPVGRPRRPVARRLRPVGRPRPTGGETPPTGGETLRPAARRRRRRRDPAHGRDSADGETPPTVARRPPNGGESPGGEQGEVLPESEAGEEVPGGGAPAFPPVALPRPPRRPQQGACRSPAATLRCFWSSQQDSWASEPVYGGWPRTEAE